MMFSSGVDDIFYLYVNNITYNQNILYIFERYLIDIIMKKFTFKTIKPTGQFRSFDHDEIVIKLDKKECGNILPTEPYTIKLQVIKADIMEDGNKNCPWKWIRLKPEFKSIEEAKEFLNNNFEKITKLNIYLHE